MEFMSNWKRVGVISMAAGFAFCLMLSTALAAEMDKKAEKMVMDGTKTMMTGKKDLMAGLGKQKLTKDPKLAEAIKKLNAGDKEVVAGNKMMGKKGERTKAKEKIMSGTTMMMEAKDAIMAELKSRGMMKEGKLEEGEKLMVQGDNKMLEGKNGMMDGFKNWE